MSKLAISILLPFIIATTFITSRVESQVIEIESLSQIELSDSPETLVLLDIDDTLIVPKGMVGSRIWRKYIKETTKRFTKTNWHDQLSLYVAELYPVVTVEESTKAFVDELQATGHQVLAFTARERNKWYDTAHDAIDCLTVQQLRSVDIDFAKKPLSDSYSYIAEQSEYYGGIIFSNLDSKGEYLEQLLNQAKELPKKVVFVDDKLSHVEAVDKILEKLNIDHAAYYYTKVTANGEIFDPLIADIQLYYLWAFGKVLTDDEAAAVAEEHKGVDPAFYLEAILEGFDSRCALPAI